MHFFIQRRAALLAGVSTLLTSRVSLAQPSVADTAAWPSKPVRVIVPFAAGGVADNLGRFLAHRLGQTFGQPFVIENTTGAGGGIGAAAVARAAPDGYTLLMGTIGTHSINPTLFKKLPYDHRRDFQPVSLVATSPQMLVVGPAVPAKTVAELIAYLKASPGRTYASGSPGSTSHLTAEMFAAATGVKITHVPYRGSPPALNDVMAGHVDLFFDNISTAWPLAKAGKVKALAVTSKGRSQIAPDVPALAETIPGFEATAWHAMFAPAQLPAPILEKLANEVRNTLRKPDAAEHLGAMGVTPLGSTPAELASYVNSETIKWAKVIKDGNITVD